MLFMAKQSAGLLLYRLRDDGFEVLIVHPGGPFWARKDNGAWSIPKGEFESDDDPLEAAKREFQEELGHPAPNAECRKLGVVKMKSGKIIHAWAAEGDLDTAHVRSNTFTVEWPPRTGQQQEYPEVDRAIWAGPTKAAKKLNPVQAEFVGRLAVILGIAGAPEQTTLL